MYKIAFVGNFDRLSVGEPEEALALEELGHKVIRLQEGCRLQDVEEACKDADFLLVNKFRCSTSREVEAFMQRCRIPVVVHIFDLYVGL